MAASSENRQYLLPGERATLSSIVHHHGLLTPARNGFNFVSRIYKPQENDFVIGVVLIRTADWFLIDINSTEAAVLPMAAFDTGRTPSRKSMNRLSVVYARVEHSDSWAQTVLSCRTPDHFQRRGPFGLWEDGCILRCSLALCQKLQHSPLLNELSRMVPGFRVCLSPNGLIWYTANATNSMVAIKNIIEAHELQNDMHHLFDLYRRSMDELERQDNLLKNSNQA